MGAWGIGPFENDGALDLIAEMRSGNFSFDELGWAFDDEDYLEVDGGQIAIALAELAAAIAHGGPSPVEELDLSEVSAQFTSEKVAYIRKQVERTLSDGEHSELYELWQETDDFAVWLASSRATLERLR